MKKCSKCHQIKDETEFSKKDKWLQPYCKPCHSSYRKEHYERNKKKIITQVTVRQEELYLYILNYKVEKGCLYCGEKHPACLDLHHRDSDTKTITPANMANQGWCKKRIDKELALCDVLCANCHRKEHWRR